MPEGDTIFRTARTLGRVLEGREITRVDGNRRDLLEADLVGRRVATSEARGKNLLLHLDDGRVVYSHMGMKGSWHVYRSGEAWRRPARLAALALENHKFVAVCFTPPTLELLSERAVARHRVLSRLGPDLLASTFDRRAAARRFAQRPELPIGEALMNQTLACGIGNVYKSEVLFVCATSPFTRVGELPAGRLEELLDRARELMLANLDDSTRRTRNALDGEPLWIYGRAGKACRRCRGTVKVRRQGDLGRTTYYCESCQP